MVTAGRPARAHRDVVWVANAPAGAAKLAGWTAMYDRDTDAPVRMWGPSHPAPGTVASAAAAEAWAREFLASHVSVLAPGAAAADFTLVSNQLNPSGDLRSVGFVQTANGVPVLGGSVSFAFKNDRMVMVGSTALPNVPSGKLALRGARLATARAATAASSWLASAGLGVVATPGVASRQVVLPIIHGRTAKGPDITYALVEQIQVESTTNEPGRWNVYVDAATGAAVARENLLSFGTARVTYQVWDRAPLATGAPSTARPAPLTRHTINVAGTITNPISTADGAVEIGDGTATITTSLEGPLVKIININAGTPPNIPPPPVFSHTESVVNGGTVTVDQHATPALDAQLTAYIYSHQVKQFVRDKLAPDLALLNDQLPVTVNETRGQCNAYADPKTESIHFLPLTPNLCENTARIADVVYHEFGHLLHHAAVIEGVGAFHPSMSEGVADTLAVAIIGDSGMARGFFLNNIPLRELNPATRKVWPADANGEVHDEGEIYGQAMYALRKKLETKLGATDGFAHFLKIYYSTVQRGIDIPSTYAEALLADDDDGNLANGTPNDCDIIAAFIPSGLFNPHVLGSSEVPTRDNFTISVRGPAAAAATCRAPSITSASVKWRVAGSQAVSYSEIPLSGSGTTLTAQIPQQPNGSVVEYQVRVALSNGAVTTYPVSRGEPYYTFYVGNVTTLWCTDFESGIADWTHTASDPKNDLWEVGTPVGLGGDPKGAFAGANALGMAVTTKGFYTASTQTSITSPEIDLQGNPNIRLQYRRWLNVEDGIFDEATISANDVVVWKNHASATDANASSHTTDQEWVLHDVDLSKQTASGKLRLKFALNSDAGLELGGWTMDDVCLVVPEPVCGNTITEDGETCDDGNALTGDGCTPACDLEDSGGCCGVGTGPAGPALLSLGVLALLLRRRRRA